MGRRPARPGSQLAGPAVVHRRRLRVGAGTRTRGPVARGPVARGVGPGQRLAPFGNSRVHGRHRGAAGRSAAWRVVSGVIERERAATARSREMPGALQFLDGLADRPRAVVTLLPEGAARETLEAHVLRVDVVVGRDPRITPKPGRGRAARPWIAWAPARTGVDGRRQHRGRSSGGGRRRGRLRSPRSALPSRPTVVWPDETTPQVRCCRAAGDRAAGRDGAACLERVLLWNSGTRRVMTATAAQDGEGPRGVDIVDRDVPRSGTARFS